MAYAMGKSHRGSLARSVWRCNDADLERRTALTISSV